MRWIALALVVVTLAGGCKTVEVKSATFSVNLNVTVPVPPTK